MQTTVKIMDIDVDMISNDIFIEKMNEYLGDEKMDIILFASTGLLDMAMQDESYKEIVKKAQMFLPGEEALLSMHNVDMLEAGGMVVSCESFGLLLENLTKQDRTLYIIAKNEAEIIKIEKYCKKRQPRLKVVGSYSYDKKLEDAAIINEINSHVPDMIVIDLPTGEQEKWVNDHAAMLNAKICVEIGGVAQLVLSRQKLAPDWVHKLHLGNVFKHVVQEQSVKKDMKARFFRKKVIKYNTKVEEKIIEEEKNYSLLDEPEDNNDMDKQ